MQNGRIQKEYTEICQWTEQKLNDQNKIYHTWDLQWCLNWQSYIQSGGGYASDKEYNDMLFSLQHVISLLLVVCLFVVVVF